MKAVIICILAALCWVCTVDARLYKWVDEEGVTHYSNKRPTTMHQVETESEIRSGQSNKKYNKKLDRLLNSYEKDSFQEKVINSDSNTYESTITPDKNRLQYLKNRISHREKIVHRCKDDLIDLKRTPYKDYRSHKNRLRYYEDRLEHAKFELNEAKRQYDDYYNSK
jgi:hypothetical protein